jgi:hypothetical protein
MDGQKKRESKGSRISNKMGERSPTVPRVELLSVFRRGSVVRKQSKHVHVANENLARTLGHAACLAPQRLSSLQLLSRPKANPVVISSEYDGTNCYCNTT